LVKQGHGRAFCIDESIYFDGELHMTIYTEGTVARLQGDLTHSGATHNIIDLLAASLQKIVSGEDKNIRIDCGRIGAADFSGLQLLYVWMQCARFRGVEPELVNLSDSLLQTLQSMGLSHCFAG
jgi:ABC-type transporter Mla MlaB component